MSKKVFVGLSGGVDSSVAAARLVREGYDVVGVYMKNWTKPIGKYHCPWEDDYKDAKRVATHLKIPFETFDFQEEYFEKVVVYMIDAFKEGITPNPDVMCNQEIKFRLFFDTSRDHGADYIATGHYAYAWDGRLYRAADEQKDQTYFLYRVRSVVLDRTLFPLHDQLKSRTREQAVEYGLPTAHRKESMGICFVGTVGMKEFLQTFVGKQDPGPIINQHGITIGEHEGALFYTIGQRSGLGVGGGLPFYVTGKDMGTNEVFVTSDISDPGLWTDVVRLSAVHWITGTPSQISHVRNRHRAPLVEVVDMAVDNSGITTLTLAEQVRALTPGQSTVFYNGDECLGGGIVV